MKDEAIEAIRQRRRKLFREKYNGSIDQLVAAAIKWEQKHPEQVVHAHRRRTAVA